MIFAIFKTYRDAKKGIKDPAGFGQEMALDVIRTPILLLTIIGVIFFVGLILLSFTGIIGGPYLFLKIVFWILFIPFILFELIVWSIFNKVKKMTEVAKNRINEKINTIKVEPE